MTKLRERAEKLARYFDWDIPSEQFNEVLSALREYGDERENEALEKAALWLEKFDQSGDARLIRALKTTPVGKGGQK